MGIHAELDRPHSQSTKHEVDQRISIESRGNDEVESIAVNEGLVG